MAGSGYCADHQHLITAWKREHDAHRPSARERGYGSKWQKARDGWLKRYPNCVDCGEPATEVDHEIPHKGDMKLFWDRTNWRSRCKKHHSRKTATRDSAFANGSRKR
jgi:5-methylcytosine-specific restriction protein A